MLRFVFFNQAPYHTYYGNGDSTYIELPNGQNMLVDISTQVGGESVVKKLQEMQVKCIDYFVVSHLHKDHTAGFGELIKHIDVKHVILSGYGFKSVETDFAFLEIVRNKDIPMKCVRAGQEFNVGDLHLQVLFPTEGIPEVSPDLPFVEQEINSNMYSLVIKMSYGKFSALFTGDIYEKTEKQIIETCKEILPSALLKIPHHGNNSSASQAFIDAVAPKMAVTMCRSCEWEVQQRFSNTNILVYGPFYDGTIIAETDGDILEVICDKGTRKFVL